MAALQVVLPGGGAPPSQVVPLRKAKAPVAAARAMEPSRQPAARAAYRAKKLAEKSAAEVAAQYPNQTGYSIGQAVNLPQGSIGPEIQGRYLGWGTNRDPNAFKTKLTLPIDGPLAAQLNAQLAQNPQAQQVLRAVGFAGYGTDQDVPTITVLNRAVDRYPEKFAFLPGSAQQKEYLFQGIPVGLVKVSNPYTTHQFSSNRHGKATPERWAELNKIQGYMAVGGPTWRASFQQALQEDLALATDMFQKGAAYGLWPFFLKENITQPQQLAGLGPMRKMATYYNENLKDADRQRAGFAGAAQLYASHLNFLKGGEANLQYVQAPSQPHKAGLGMALGKVHWVEGKARNTSRKGSTAFPLRDALGNPMRGPQAAQMGSCNIYGSGPGVTQGARNAFGFRFRQKRSRAKPSIRAVLNGEDPRDMAKAYQPSYSCGPSVDSVNLTSRKYVPTSGKGRGGRLGAAALVAQRGLAGWSAADIDEGTDPAYALFSRSPSAWPTYVKKADRGGKAAETPNWTNVAAAQAARAQLSQRGFAQQQARGLQAGQVGRSAVPALPLAGAEQKFGGVRSRVAALNQAAGQPRAYMRDAYNYGAADMYNYGRPQAAAYRHHGRSSYMGEPRSPNFMAYNYGRY